MTMRFAGPLIGVLAFVFAASALAAAPARLIVRVKPEAQKSGLTAKARIEKLGASTGVPLVHVRSMAMGADVVVAQGANADAAAQIAARLAADPDVDYAVVDRRVHPMQFAPPPVNDVFAPEQHSLANIPTAISAYDAWTVTHGSPNIVVAVIDTDYRPPAAMTGRFLPGYDMISDAANANDGDGRDADASDPGNWVTAAEATPDCPAHNSIWHGTSVAGIIAANTNDGA